MSDKVQITIKNKVGEKYADLQTKIVNPSKETQVITADEGYYGLREVIVGPPVIDIDLLANEINSMKESITEGDATPEDIKLGKTAFVNGQKVEGTYKISGTLDITSNGVYNVTDYATANVQTGGSIKKYLDLTKTTENMFGDTGKYVADATEYLSYNDTENVTDMSNMFYWNEELIKVPVMNVTNVSNMYRMFYTCTKLKEVIFKDTPSLTNCEEMCRFCYKLETLIGLNLINITGTNARNMLMDCKKLKNLSIKNIKVDFYVGYASGYGHLLTFGSLIDVCQECIDVGEPRTLTMGTTNLEKLANTYVRLTGEAEEDDNNPKLPFETCTYVDEGSMTVSQYMALKNWTIA